jgi:FkbM family methyltransferase
MYLVSKLLKKLGFFKSDQSNYAWSLPYLKNKRDCTNIIEVGSRDALDLIYLGTRLRSTGIAFECVPENIQICEENIRKSAKSGLSVDPRCLSDTSEKIDFFAVDPKKYDNPGAGSIFKLDFNTRAASDPDRMIGVIQETIRVDAIRFEETGYPAPHTVFMDVQGAELLVLQGFGGLLADVTNVVLETSLRSTYKNAANFWQIYDFLIDAGFKYVVSNKYGIKLPPKIIPDFFGGEFDCLFSK